MPVNSLECPNCGAPLEQTQEALIRCAFCSSTLQVKPENSSKGSSAWTETPPATALPTGPEPDLPPAQRPAVPPISLEEARALAEHIARLVRQRRRIEAVRIYRERTGAGLIESKQATDTLAFAPPTPEILEALRAGWQPGPRQKNPALGVVRRLAQEGRPEEAARLYQGLTGSDSPGARAALDAMLAEPPTDPRLDQLQASLLCRLVLEGRMRAAVRLYAQSMGVRPLEAREVVEALAAGMRIPLPARIRARFEDV
jgi:DNA-directed RNA polymerase subunit RPC12/RpoP